MKLFLVFLFVSFMAGIIFQDIGTKANFWLVAGISLFATALYFLFTAQFI